METSLTIFMICVLVLASVLSVGFPKRRDDPMEQMVSTRKTVTPCEELPINILVKDPEEADRYVHFVATGGVPNSLTDEAVLQTVSDIVNNDKLSTDAKYYMLDGLQQRIWNDHPHGMAAKIAEVVADESISLTHPDWHGRCGDFVSMRKGG